MIKTEKGLVKISGSESELLADLSCIINALLNCDGITKEKIKNSVKVAFMTPEERCAEIVKVFANMIGFEEEDKKVMESLFKDIFGKEM